MKLLLDENLHRVLKTYLKGHEVYTVHEKKWTGIKNGELLRRMARGHFDALITADKNLAHQQNPKKMKLTVVVLDVQELSLNHLLAFVPKLERLLKKKLHPGVIILE